MEEKARFRIATGSILVFLSLCLGCSHTSTSSSTDLSMPGPDTLKELLVESEVIVDVNLTGVEEIEKEGHKKVKRMDVQVTNVIRGDKNLIDRIITIRTLHPLLAWRDPDQRRYLLFLEHLEGDANERAHYQIVGLTSGIMMIDPQGHLFWTKGEPLIPGSKKFYMDEAFTGLTIEEAREKINGILDGK